jgi:hypothetical protein
MTNLNQTYKAQSAFSKKDQVADFPQAQGTGCRLSDGFDLKAVIKPVGLLKKIVN